MAHEHLPSSVAFDDDVRYGPAALEVRQLGADLGDCCLVANSSIPSCERDGECEALGSVAACDVLGSNGAALLRSARWLPTFGGDGLPSEMRVLGISWRRSGVLLALSLGVAARPAHACDCARAGQPCRAFQTTPVVFSGEVVSIAHRVARGKGDYEDVTFRVITSLKGTRATTLHVATGMGGGDCGFSFVVGRRYVVYALRSDQTTLSTSSCTRTRPVEDAADDLAYGAQWRRGDSGRGLVGQIGSLVRDSVNGTIATFAGWLRDVPITVTRGAERWNTRTDDSGRFGVWNLQPGHYVIRPKLPRGFLEMEDTTTIARGDACSEVRFLATPPP